MKKSVTEALILIYSKQGLKIIVKTNFSDYIGSKVFFHLGKDKLLYLITIHFKNRNYVECNYRIYDKDVIAII